MKKIDLVQNDQLMDSIKMVCDLKNPYVGIFVKRDDANTSDAVNSIDELYPVGTFGNVVELNRVHPKRLEMFVSAHRRIRLLEKLDTLDNEQIGRTQRRKKRVQPQQLTPNREEGANGTEEPQGEKPLLYARIENVVEPVFKPDDWMKATIDTIIMTIREIASYSPLFQQQIINLLIPKQNVTEDPIALCDLVGTIVETSTATTQDLQDLMEKTDVMERLRKALELLEKEKTILRMRNQIKEDVERKVNEQHRKAMLYEHLKAIKRELGIEKEDKQAVLEKMEERLANLKVPEYAMKVIKEEQAKLSFLDPHSSEFSISRNYLDWLTSVPWGKTSEENMDVHKARQILEEDHYGMKDVKERILEFIAVGILKQQTNGKILCFHGPPGVGKTSIAKSIARALNREYYRFSVGGMTDVAEIKGHRRTYVGAMPGKLIQCLKKVQTENPLVLIDEVDKIGREGYHGDPSSALLEVLDPEQNANFLDHFLDVPVDLSKVLFICTANVTDTIPGPLKDRMEMIEVAGYVAEEKLEIARKYLVPKCREKCALPDEKLVIKDDAIDSLIKSYCRESGVRNLEKHIEKIFRKSAYQLVSGEGAQTQMLPIVVENSNLKKYVGREKFTSDRLYPTTPVGVVMGLAWTAMGGSALYVEATLARRLGTPSTDVQQVTDEKSHQKTVTGHLEVTGHLGDVMKESMRTAYTVAKNVLLRKDPQNEFLEKAYIHLHLPEGAVPKDGPSAGCTVVSALMSLALDRPVIQQTAMTGEVSLTGKILPVGGIKEKIIAAKRAGVGRIILPSENRKDFEDLADFIKKDVDAHFVSHYDEIYELVFQ
ncbi:hypothetical protein niasHS_003597 [Heterodera schachtii]|uniref:Lon protease homolog n=1 Tax=Heterodera schachtii TaxID=97005 RepID=A0ABD2KHF8_HETSC